MNPPAVHTALANMAGNPEAIIDGLNYPFFQAVWDRKSRRVALGLEITSGPLAYTSPYEPVPLSEVEEALLLMAATGLNGLNLADIDRSTHPRRNTLGVPISRGCLCVSTLKGA